MNRQQVFNQPTVNMALLYQKNWMIAAFLMITNLVQEQSLEHLGLLYTQTDLNRMKDRVAQGIHLRFY